MNTPEIYKDIFKKLTNQFFDVVPLELCTFCVVNTKICCDVLNHFGIEASSYVCQVRHYSSKEVHNLGFVGHKLAKGQWNGHVICKSEDFFIDAALFTFKKQFNLEVPLIVGLRANDFEQQQFAHYSLSDGCELKWFQAPDGFDESLPTEPFEIISKYTQELVRRIDASEIHQ